jgi:signal transduction histidine kinase
MELNRKRGLSSQDFHDLKTPLNQIIGYSELLVELAEDEEKPAYLPDLLKIRAAGRQLLGLLDGAPSAALPVPSPPTAPSPPVSKPPGPAASVLVVDDNPMNRDVLSRRIERDGHKVSAASDGAEALSMLKSRPFDVVLLDVMMPNVDGYEVLRSMKDDALLRHVPVIMISALDEEESVIRCIQLGAEDYLPKPFNATLLRARMGACLEKKRGHDREALLTEQLRQNLVRLQNLEQLRDDLTHMVVHDLRTPLTSLIAGMQSMEAMGDLNPDQQEMMQIAVDGGDTLLGMINDLLDVSQMEAGAMQLVYEDVDVYRLLSEARLQVSSLLRGKELTVIEELQPGLASFRGDETKLRRVLVNLLGNAIKFTPRGGTVTVVARASEDGNSLDFAVRDTGEGIPPEEFERIFEKFGQVESRKGGRTMSTGLGLTFCKLAANAHGGNIGVESIPGKGSTFFFSVSKGAPPQVGLPAIA